MKTSNIKDTTNRRQKLTIFARIMQIAIGIILLTLGLTVMIGWHTENFTLIRVFPAFMPMFYNTAICFAVSGTIILLSAVNFRRLPIILSAFVLLTGTATLIEYAAQTDFGIDQLLMHYYMDLSGSHPGRMALNTAICFTFSGMAFLLSLRKRPQIQGADDTQTDIIGTLAVLIFVTGTAALTGYLMGIPQAYNWGIFSSMAVHAAFGFMLLGTGIVLLNQREFYVKAAKSLYWLPTIIGFMMLALTLNFYLALNSYRRVNIQQTVEGQAKTLEYAVENGVKERVQALERMAARWSKSGGTEYNEWQSDAENYNKNFNTFENIQWVDANFVVRWIEPLTGNQSVIDKNLALEQERRDALENSLRRHATIISATIPLESDERGILVYAPVYRNEKFDGFILGVSNVQTLLRRVSPDELKNDYSIAVIENNQDIYEDAAGENTSGVDWHTPLTIHLSGKEWRLKLTPRPATLSKLESKLPEAVLIAGLIVSLLLSATVYLLQKSRRETIVSRNAQREIGKREELYRTLVRNLPKTAVVIFDRDFRYTLADGVQLQEHGFTPEQFEGKTLHEVFPPEISAEWEKKYQRALAGEIFSLENEVGGKHILTQVLPVKNENGEVFSGMVMWSDVTETKQMQNELQKEREFLEAMLENISDGIIACDANGKPTIINRVTRELHAIPPDAILDPDRMGNFDLYQEDGVTKIGLPDSPLFRALEGEIINEMPLVVQPKNQAPRYVLSSGRAILGKDGEKLGAVVVIHDITEKRQAETALRESRQRISDLLEHSPVGIVLTDKRGGVTFVNDRWSKITGLSEAEAKGAGWTNAIHHEDRERMLEEWTEKSRVEEETVYEFRFVGDGKTTEVLARAIKQYDANGEFSGHLSTVSDVSEIKKLHEDLKVARDAALESARLKSEFLANMSHEIRTPMNGVMGMTEMLLDTPLDQFQQEAAQTIRTSSEALLNIINDILDFSKIEAGKLNFETIDFDLLNTIESTVELFAEQGVQKNIELASLVDENVPLGLWGDPGRLRQVLTNLIGNAVKFTAHGEVFVRVSLEKETKEGVKLRFSITDTGIGIKPEAQKFLFQAFTQADGSMTRKYGGTGLGLAISKQLAELMNGEISVESEPGKGSVFSFTALFQKQIAPVEKLAPRSDLKNVRVLIVDDNATNRKILMHQTTSWGMLAAEAADGFEAIEELHRAERAGNPYELAILDLMMPVMDGFHLARRIKSETDIAATRLILMPSYGQRGHGKNARDIGIGGYLIKPVKQNELFNCVAAVMGEQAEIVTTDLPAPLVTRYTLEEQKPLMTNQPKILVAEDNAVNQTVLRQQLEFLGYRADIVSNGRLAIEALRRQTYALVLMDCQMPEMDGFEATEAIRKSDNIVVRKIPIIAVTANAMQGEREKCLAAGMDEYLAKPFKKEELRIAVESFLKAGTPETVAENETVEAINSALTDEIEHKTFASVAEKAQKGLLAHDVRKYLSELEKDIGAETIEIIINLFKEDAAERLEKLRSALADSDFRQIEAEAHRIKGGCANLGAKSVAAICQKIEDEAEAHNLDESHDLFVRLEAKMPVLMEILDEFITVSAS